MCGYQGYQTPHISQTCQSMIIGDTLHEMLYVSTKMTPPANSLIARMRASTLSMSRWLVGSSRIRILGLCRKEAGGGNQTRSWEWHRSVRHVAQGEVAAGHRQASMRQIADRSFKDEKCAVCSVQCACRPAGKIYTCRESEARMTRDFWPPESCPILHNKITQHTK